MKKQTKIIGLIVVVILVVAFVLVSRKMGPDSVFFDSDTAPYSSYKSDVTVIEKDSQGRPIQQMHKTSGGSLFGAPVEYVYYGNLQADKPVQVVYVSEPGDGVLTITGAVNQTIQSSAPDFPSTTAFIDISSGSNVVSVDEDYNFDGYNDLYVMSANSEGFFMDYANVFLYNPTSQKFIYNAELSKLKNIAVNSNLKYVQEMYLIDESGEPTDASNYGSINYKWVNGNLVKVKK